GTLGAGHLALGVDGGRPAGAFEELGCKAVLLQEAQQVLGVAPNVHRIARNVGDGDELGELLEQPRLVLGAPSSNAAQELGAVGIGGKKTGCYERGCEHARSSSKPRRPPTTMTNAKRAVAGIAKPMTDVASHPPRA